MRVDLPARRDGRALRCLASIVGTWHTARHSQLQRTHNCTVAATHVTAHRKDYCCTSKGTSMGAYQDRRPPATRTLHPHPDPPTTFHYEDLTNTYCQHVAPYIPSTTGRAASGGALPRTPTQAHLRVVRLLELREHCRRLLVQPLQGGRGGQAARRQQRAVQLLGQGHLCTAGCRGNVSSGVFVCEGGGSGDDGLDSLTGGGRTRRSMMYNGT